MIDCQFVEFTTLVGVYAFGIITTFIIGLIIFKLNSQTAQEESE